MRIYLDQLGCRLNFSENHTLAGRLRAAGHRIVSRPEEAQVIVLNTCAVTGEAARKSRQTVRHLHRRNPRARIAVTGCYATLQPQEASTLPGVALVAPNPEKEMLHALLEPWSAELEDPEDLARMQPNGVPFQEPLPPVGEQWGRTRAFVKVQDGCDNRCTFCIVTVLRGRSRSRPLQEVVQEIQRLVEAGYREAVLTGVHLGAYGRDLPGEARTDLKELVAAILVHTDLPRLRLSSLEPWELADGFFALWSRVPTRLCPHLHLPLQAGSDTVLRRMARRCTTASYRALVAEARQAIPDLVLTTDLIVGFPGETETAFQEGLAFVEEMRFAHAHIFPFSPRAGTAAATFDGQVSPAVKRARSRRLRQVVERTGRAERERFVGTTRPVLWEGQGEPVEDRPHMRLWTGLTDNYLRVLAYVPGEVDLHNRITQTRLEALHGETLFGTPELSGMSVQEHRPGPRVGDPPHPSRPFPIRESFQVKE